MRGNEAAVAPPHDPNSLRIDVRQRVQILNGCQHVVDLLAAVVDRIVVRGAVTRAATIVGRNDDVTALHRLLHERQHRLRPIAMHATVHPHHCRVPARSALGERCEEIAGNLHPVGAALVCDLLELVRAARTRCQDAVGPRFLGDLSREVGLRLILGAIADVQLFGARGVNLYDLPRPLLSLAQRSRGLLLCREWR